MKLTANKEKDQKYPKHAEETWKGATVDKKFVQMADNPPPAKKPQLAGKPSEAKPD